MVRLRRAAFAAFLMFLRAADLRLAISASPLEELDRALMLQRRGARLECSEVAAPTRFRIDLARVKAKFAGGELSDHGVFLERFD
jgi:hypothetical protein